MLVIFVASYHCRINSFSVFQLFDGLRYIISLDLSILSFVDETMVITVIEYSD